MALIQTRLFDGDLLTIRHVACRPAHRAAGDVEQVAADTIVLPGRGVFCKHLSRSTELLAEPTQALLFAAGRPYRISHPDLRGDDCLSLRFAPGPLHEALATTAAVDGLGSRALRPGGSLAAAAIAARALLWRRLSGGVADALEVEETSLGLLDAVIAAARWERAPVRARPATRAQWRRQAFAVREALLADPARRWTLRELARAVHASPFHLARLFRQETGSSVHQYQLRVRLADAVRRLLDTRQSLSAIALELGFASHSHFTAAFRRLVGVPPDHFRRRAGAADARELQRRLVRPPARAR